MKISLLINIQNEKSVIIIYTIINYNIRSILDSEQSEGSSGFTMVFSLLFLFFILYTKFLPEKVLRFQHIVYYLLENWIKMVL